MDQSTPQAPFCYTTAAKWHHWSTSNEAIFSSTSFPWEINSNYQQVPTQGNQSDLTWTTWQAQTQNQWAELNLPKSCPSSTSTGGSCESRTGVSDHRAALKNSPARAAAFLPLDHEPCPANPSWDRHKEVQGGCAGCEPPRPILPQQPFPSAVLSSTAMAGCGKHLCAAERGEIIPSHYLKQTFR